jgi:hypothetical protein
MPVIYLNHVAAMRKYPIFGLVGPPLDILDLILLENAPKYSSWNIVL